MGFHKLAVCPNRVNATICPVIYTDHRESSISRVQAEAEVLAAITTFFKNVGITSKDVGIKVNNRKVLQAVLEKFETPEELFAPVCGACLAHTSPEIKDTK